MRVRDGIAAWLTVLAFVPAVVADDQAPANKDQPQAQAVQQADQQQADQQKADAQNKEKAQNNTTQANPIDNKMQEGLASCLALSNHAEIEMAKLALERTQNADVRKLAQQMLDDHTAAAEKLKQFMPRVHATADQSASQENQLANLNHDVMQKLMQKIAQNELTMTKEVLMRYEGQDFDMGYLGQQILAHTQMLAKLYAMQDLGTPEFQTTLKDMTGTVKEHFKHATHLSLQLEGRDDRPATSAASTTTNKQTRQALSAEPESKDRPAAPAPKEKKLEKAGNRQSE
jgi:predicted outer membrane protein